jgi:hypothetical protein
MTDRFASLLNHLARVFLAGAVLAPVLFGLAQVIPPRPEVEWAVSVPWFGGPRTGVPSEDRHDAPWGSSLALRNTGNSESEPLRIVLDSSDPAAPVRPSHVEVRREGRGDHELIPTETGAILDLGTLKPGDGLEVTLYRVTWMDVDAVLQGDEPVPQLERPPFFDDRVRLPRWTLLAGLLLLAGLAVQALATRRHLGSNRVG